MRNIWAQSCNLRQSSSLKNAPVPSQHLEVLFVLHCVLAVSLRLLPRYTTPKYVLYALLDAFCCYPSLCSIMYLILYSFLCKTRSQLFLFILRLSSRPSLIFSLRFFNAYLAGPTTCTRFFTYVCICRGHQIYTPRLPPPPHSPPWI